MKSVNVKKICVLACAALIAGSGIAAAAQFPFSTLISDSLDKTLQNRAFAGDADIYPASLDLADTQADLSPLRGANDVSVATATHLYRIGPEQFRPFAQNAVRDPVANAQYTQTQNFWVGSRNANNVAYDSSAAFRDVISKYSVMAYNTKFAGNDFGIPKCSAPGENGNWAECPMPVLTATHRTRIKFMGSTWTITEMNAPAAALPSPDAAINGGSVKLAKEAAYGVLRNGASLSNGQLSARLSSISREADHPAIIDILDANNNVVGQITVRQGTTYTFVQANAGTTIKIHLYETTYSARANQQRAKMSVLSDEITLQDNRRYNLVAANDPNHNYMVSLLWKNRDYVQGASTVADSLREIVVYNQDEFAGGKYGAGDAVSFPAQGSAYTLTFNGVQAPAARYERLQINALAQDTYRIAVSDNLASCAANAQGDLSYTARLIELRTTSNSFGGAEDLLSIGGRNYAVNKIYYDPSGIVGNGTTLNGTQNLSADMTQAHPRIFFKRPGTDCYVYKNVTTLQPDAQAVELSPLSTVRFAPASARGGDVDGLLFFTTPSLQQFTRYYSGIGLQEDAGAYLGAQSTAVKTIVPLWITNTSLRFKLFDRDVGTMDYSGIAENFQQSHYELPFTTERGSKVNEVSTSFASIDAAKQVLQAKFTFSNRNNFDDAALDNAVDVVNVPPEIILPIQPAQNVQAQAVAQNVQPIPPAPPILPVKPVLPVQPISTVQPAQPVAPVQPVQPLTVQQTANKITIVALPSGTSGEGAQAAIKRQ
ncbi:Uncharacterised protein [Candidatus Anstonella stagnisolia]|nr:Uncharacterised protein [Candidatus Anstonella stagnisolia]